MKMDVDFVRAAKKTEQKTLQQKGVLRTQAGNVQDSTAQHSAHTDVTERGDHALPASSTQTLEHEHIVRDTEEFCWY
jgi:hypothetical protein